MQPNQYGTHYQTILKLFKSKGNQTFLVRDFSINVSVLYQLPFWFNEKPLNAILLQSVFDYTQKINEYSHRHFEIKYCIQKDHILEKTKNRYHDLASNSDTTISMYSSTY